MRGLRDWAGRKPTGRIWNIGTGGISVSGRGLRGMRMLPHFAALGAFFFLLRSVFTAQHSTGGRRWANR